MSAVLTRLSHPAVTEPGPTLRLHAPLAVHLLREARLTLLRTCSSESKFICDNLPDMFAEERRAYVGERLRDWIGLQLDHCFSLERWIVKHGCASDREYMREHELNELAHFDVSVQMARRDWIDAMISTLLLESAA